MATYFVEVNAKFLVKLEYDGSACGAEHYFLDQYKGCWGANAYDEKALKTECFRGAILTSEIVSLKELDRMFKNLERGYDRVDEYKKGLKALSDQLEQLQAQYDEVKAKYLNMMTESGEELKAVKELEKEAAAQPRFKA